MQNFEYDEFTGDYFACVYTGTKPQFPNYPMFVVDGSKAALESELAGHENGKKGLVLSLKDTGKCENGIFTKVGEVEIRFEDNKLMLSVSKNLIENSDSISFKWADNYREDDVYSFYTSGDAAPYGRLCYSY